jgi:gamma-glutamyl-gamma-aminobutyrate hydrolase PuuD
MKKLVISQRVDEHKVYSERRDGLDQRWFEFADRLGCAPMPLPNIQADRVDAYLDTIEPDVIILSGGNTLLAQAEDAEDTAPERDQFEAALLVWGLANKKPVLGVCRGMQFINHFFGGSTCELSGHVACRHRVSFAGDFSDTAPMDVNSFHNWGIPPDQLGEALFPMAITADGTVEALSHVTQKVAGIMWHPERENPFDEADLTLVRRLLEL